MGSAAGVEFGLAVTGSAGVGVEDWAKTVAVAVGWGASGVGDAALPQAVNAARNSVADATLASIAPVANFMSINPLRP